MPPTISCTPHPLVDNASRIPVLTRFLARTLRQREFPLFADTYHELRAEGLPFSEQYQSDRPPVLDPGSGSLLDQPSAEPGGREGGHPPPQPPHPNPPHPHHANPQHARPPASASGSASSSAGRSGGGERGGRAKRVEERGVEMTAPASALSAAPAVARRVKTELSGACTRGRVGCRPEATREFCGCLVMVLG